MVSIRTTHVGSLPRSQEVVDCIFARENKQPYDVAHFDATMAAAVDATVARQVDAGIDIVSDGETSKISYATYIKDRYSGFAGDSPRKPPADLQQFPRFLERLANAGGTPQYARPQCVDAVASLGTDDLGKDIANLKNAMAKHHAHGGFMNAASPGVVALFMPNAYYPNHEAYLMALADALHDEYQAIVAAGLHLQIDCPDLALSRHMMFADLSDSEFVRIANQHVAALNHALAGIDCSKVRLHICWGNYEGPHTCDIDMAKMFATLMSVQPQMLLFETANPRHGHEWQVFAERKHDIPDDKILIPGVIDSTTNFVEHPQLIKQRIERFTNIVGRERVMAGSDCGFGTFAGFGVVDADIVYAKLTALAQGAAMA